MGLTDRPAPGIVPFVFYFKY